MASERQALILILLSLFTFSFIMSSQASTGEIAIYWGQNYGDGNLTATCDTGNYGIVILAFFTTFGCGRTPAWNFDGHCGHWSPCTKLKHEIDHCQEKGIKVFLSIGGASENYSLCSPEDAKEVAEYLYNKFLSDYIGRDGPLGPVTLDGIDFHIEAGSNLYWDNLARELDTIRQKKHFYLSAAPKCPIPDHYLDTAIKTGLFDYIFVQFYNSFPCQYSDSNPAFLFESWDDWTSLVLPNNSVFMGLPAAPDAAPNGGYIPPQEVLIPYVLPYIKKASNYGGIMLWNRSADVQSHYSDIIKPYVPKDVLQFVTGVSKGIYECVSAALPRFLPKPY
ncbi:acidic endochitinase SE2-like [Gastrolobium bilobum]|uniref:acidic endochitinase SE2-like n=1 Tax=Gastrolobium bilobum TaxID=150636 RepID=UPI002AB1C62A|nr:acidic endochitinase SE2-like [Gastrolobium bilobum]